MTSGRKEPEKGFKDIGSWAALMLVVIITLIASVLVACLVLNVFLHQ